MQKSSFFLFSLFVLYSYPLFSQKQVSYGKSYEQYKDFFFKKYGIYCFLPKKTTRIDAYYVFWKVSSDPSKHTGSSYGPFFITDDKECIIAYPSFAYEELEDTSINTQIEAEIETSLGLYHYTRNSNNPKSSHLQIENYITRYPLRKAKKLFNADSFIVYFLPKQNSGVFLNNTSIENMR